MNKNIEWYAADPRYTEWEHVAPSLGVSVDAILFVIDALWVTPQYLGEEPGDVNDPPRHCSARELCQAIPAYAHDLFRDESVSALRDLKIYCSEDVGRIIFGLIDMGCLHARPEDRQDDFDGLCQFVTKKQTE